MREQNVKWKMCGTRNPHFSRRKSFWSNQTLMRELSLFLSIDNFAKFDASCQLHLNPRKYQTWFSSCYSGWNKSISDGLRRHGDELRQENGVGEPLLQQRGLWTLRSGKGEKKTVLRRRNKKIDSDFQVFFLVLLLVMIGEFFASPAIALADSAVIQSLGEKQVFAFLFSSKCQLLWMLTADFRWVVQELLMLFVLLTPLLDAVREHLLNKMYFGA